METKYTIYLNSINKLLEYNGAIEEKDLKDINLSQLTTSELISLLERSVEYTEVLIGMELDLRNYDISDYE